MRTILALALLLAGPALARPPLEIRFHPGGAIHAYPLDEAARYHSVQLQNAVVINRSGEPLALAAIEIELVAPPGVVEARRFEGAELEKVAMAGHMLQSSGMMAALAFQFGGEALVPAGVKLASTTVLAPGEAVLVARQFFAMRGVQSRLRVRARGLAGGRLLEGSASLPIASGMSRNAYRFPVEGAWFLAAGATLHSHHRTVVAQEFGLDLVRLDGEGRRHQGDGTRRADFKAYGARVRAAGPGKVVVAVGDEPETDEDLRRPGEPLEAYMGRVRRTQMARLARGANAVIGNHVVIAHEGGEHTVYAHLKPGSLRVAVGDAVQAGDPLGEVGTTGNSTEPHLHFHVCDSPAPLTCAGIPPRFEGIHLPLADSPRAPQTGDFIVAK